MRKAIYNSAIPKANLKSVIQSSCSASRLCLALLVLLLSTTAAFAADWGTAEEQLAKKIVAVTGPGTLSLTVENRSSLGRRDSDLVQNGLRSALEQSGIHFGKSDQAAASVALTLSENETAYVWVAEVQQGAGESAVVMVSVPRSGRSGTTYESMPITLRKVPLWAQDERILDVAVLEENGTPSRIAVLGAEEVSIVRLQNGKWQMEQTLQLGHTRPWPLDLRGRLVPAVDHMLNAYLPGVICRVTVTGAPSAITCHGSDDPWPIVSGMMNLNSPVFPTAGSSTTTSVAVPPLAGFFASTRNYFTGVLSPGIGKFSTVAKFYTAAFVPREKYTLWLFAAADGKVHLVDGMNDQRSSFEWGSDIAAVKTGCGAGSQVLATASGDQAQDSIRAFEFPDRDPVAVSAAVEFPGPVSALWTEARGDSAVAIARNRDTGSYEAFHLSL
ncbi:MAG TPA: hypothetical protein VJP02_29725, partial [Candidatus Sulfotelmatobacter sp.]|nr:hypothetical protein [Candidatus Sulfotelmatobacter sp.]